MNKKIQIQILGIFGLLACVGYLLSKGTIPSRFSFGERKAAGQTQLNEETIAVTGRRSSKSEAKGQILERWKTSVREHYDAASIRKLAEQTASILSCEDCVELIIELDGLVVGQARQVLKERLVDRIRLDSDFAMGDFIKLSSSKLTCGKFDMVLDIWQKLGSKIDANIFDNLVRNGSGVHPLALERLAYGRTHELAKTDPVQAFKVFKAGLDSVRDYPADPDESSAKNYRKIATGICFDSMPQKIDSQTARSLIEALEQSRPSCGEADSIRSKLYRRWAAAAPLDAMENLLQLKNVDPERGLNFLPSVMKGVMSSQGFQGAVDCVQSMPSGEMYDKALGGILPYLVPQYTEQGRELIRGVSNPAVRDKYSKSLEHLVRQLEAGG